MPHFSGLSAVLLNCSLVHDATKSHTRRLLARVAGVMEAEGVDVEMIHMRDYRVGFGMVKDTTAIGDETDDWPAIHAKIMASDILVIGTDLARREVERCDARGRAALRVQQRYPRRVIPVGPREPSIYAALADGAQRGHKRSKAG